MSQAETFKEITGQRRSIRAYLSKTVPKKIIDEVFTASSRAPSNCNIQPWLVHIASGKVLEHLREILPKNFSSGDITFDFPYDGKYEGVYRERQFASAKAVYDSIGVTREDKEERQKQFMRNFTFFDAPHVAFFFLPEPFGLREAADLGMFSQTVMLNLTALGLGSCPQTALSFHADCIRETLGIDKSNKLLFGLSFGYPDQESPVNTCTTERADLDDLVTYHE